MSTLIRDMQLLSSAEDFLDYFAVPYERAVVNVSRLHILKRFNQYLAQHGGVEELPPADAFAVCRRLLTQAYTDFLSTSGVEAKVFKVFRSVQGEHRVRLDSLRRG